MENFYDMMAEQAKRATALLEIVADGKRELNTTGEKFWDYLVTLDFSDGFYLISISNHDAWYIDSDMATFINPLLDFIEYDLELGHIELTEDKELDMLELLFNTDYELYHKEEFFNH